MFKSTVNTNPFYLILIIFWTQLQSQDEEVKMGGVLVV